MQQTPQSVTITTYHDDGSETVETVGVHVIPQHVDLLEFLRELEGLEFTFDEEVA